MGVKRIPALLLVAACAWSADPAARLAAGAWAERCAAARELGAAGEPGLAILVPLADSARTAERHLAAMGLAANHGPAAVPHLARLAADEQSVIAEEALAGLAASPAAEAAPALAALLAVPDLEHGRAAITARALLRHGAAAAAPAAAALAAAGAPLPARQRLAQVLAAIGAAGGEAALARLAEAPDAALPQLVWVLAATAPAEAAAAAAGRAGHADPAVRGAVALCLTRLRDPAQRPALERLAGDADAQVAQAARAGLTILDGAAR